MLLTDRGNPSVPPPNWEPLSSSALFDESGTARPDVVREHLRKEGLLQEADALTIITQCALIWKDEPNVLRVDGPVAIAGDIHGQFFDLLNLISIGGDPSQQKYIFLGDYVDRGCFGMEVILLLMCYKICYPDTMIMLRGNHESRHLTTYFNFKREVLYKYSIAVYNAIMSAFDCLPLACILNNRFLCVHGGLSPELKRISDIGAIHRFREPPSSGPMCDLLWADPLDEKEEDPAAAPLFVPNTTRGCSYVYSNAAACNFLEENDLITIIRGHEAQDEGYHLYKKTSKGFPAVICIFSAPNYCDTYDNRAAVVMLNRNIMSIRQFNSSPHPYYLPNFMNAFTWSLPFVEEKLLDIVANVLHPIDGGEDHLLVDGAEAAKAAPTPGANTESRDGRVLEQRGENIREKILAMGRLSRMFHTLCEGSESSLPPKGLTGDIPPQGGLPCGPDSVQAACRGLQQSKELDSVNERWQDCLIESDLEPQPSAATTVLSAASSSTGSR
ncbi:putative serine/threonine protein phosphatase [Leishmania major strain Friedlin]|uniref:Serine/threonine-protein phosphatase n=1 Tax=Leishmania major TaxID=5664 RepID=Q4Q8T8_LEIMA|nr:putative serine/threonine protein phosphatase [Leishmania major strain Friedlin]CAG9576581.1 serine/threonine_protein_phosphatase_-_putative [Leishmania major strain Friedlin]CAJ05636.1 putative serine/threonine protein phosphatase [Leishmania major strain Friedlin]|eukprot:XP_001684260.1 putative serine/threonine protein phosphatase [Leishmania major strain Friedlin]